jgi:dynein heavy chain 2
VDAFLNESMDVLSSRPSSIDEITKAQAAWEEVGTKRGDKKAVSAACLDKKKCLLQHAPGTDVDTSEVSGRIANVDGEGGRWDNFDIAMEAFSEMILEQKEALRSVLDDEVSDFGGVVERFAAKWRALKPGAEGSKELALEDPKVVTKVFEDLEGWLAQVGTLRDRAAGLSDSCVSFDMPPPAFEGLDAIAAELTEASAAWEQMRSFGEELGAVGAKSWIDFRGNVFELQDLAQAWADKVKQRLATGQLAPTNTNIH